MKRGQNEESENPKRYRKADEEESNADSDEHREQTDGDTDENSEDSGVESDNSADENDGWKVEPIDMKKLTLRIAENDSKLTNLFINTIYC